jgi:hypothetical protein
MASEEDGTSGKTESVTTEGIVNKTWEGAMTSKRQKGAVSGNTQSVQGNGEPERGLGESFVKEGTEVTLRAGRLPTGERPSPHAF